MAFCENCGAKLEEDDKFCPVCGNKIDNGEVLEQEEISPPKKRKSKKVILIVFIVLLLIASAGAAGLYMIDKKEEEVEKEDQREQERIEEQDLEGEREEENTEGEEKEDLADRANESEISADYTSMEAAVSDYCENSMSGANYSFYFASPEEDYEFELNSHPSRAGASGRIFVIEYIVDAVRKGEMQSSEDLLNIIRTTSTGEEPSSYSLVEQITGNYAEGLDRVRSFVEQMGYQNTSINRFNGESGNNAVNSPNQTSARDTGISISHIYEASQNGNTFASDVLEILASESSSKKGIAAEIANHFSGSVVYNFPGTYVECENDAAVVIYNGKPYVISFMMGDLHVSEGLAEQALQCMHDLTGIVCEEGIAKK